MKKPATNPVVAKLRKGDRAVYVFTDAEPSPSLYNDICVTTDQWKSRRHDKNEYGSLIIGSQLFNLLNTLKPGQTAKKPLSDGYLVGVTLLEIHRRPRTWYITIPFKRVFGNLQLQKRMSALFRLKK